jgi:hypothetical protein
MQELWDGRDCGMRAADLKAAYVTIPLSELLCDPVEILLRRELATDVSRI